MSGTVSGSERSVVPFPCVWAHVGGATFSRAVPCVLAHAGGAHSVAPFRAFWHTPAGRIQSRRSVSFGTRRRAVPRPPTRTPNRTKTIEQTPKHTHTRARACTASLRLRFSAACYIPFDSIRFDSIPLLYVTRRACTASLSLRFSAACAFDIASACVIEKTDDANARRINQCVLFWAVS